MPARLCSLFRRSAAALAWLLAAVSAAAGGDLERLKLADTQIEPLQWNELDGWAADDHAAAFAAFRASCRPIVRQRQARDERAMLAALNGPCKRALAAGAPKAAAARAFFEDNFRPVRIAKLGENS